MGLFLFLFNIYLYILAILDFKYTKIFTFDIIPTFLSIFVPYSILWQYT